MAGFGVVAGLALAQPMIDAAYALWSAGINTAAATMGAAGLNAGAVAGFGVVNGITMAQGSFDAATAAWTAAVVAQAGPMGENGLNAGAVAGFGVQNGMDMAQDAISGAAGVWPGIIDGIAGAMGENGLNAGAAAGYGVANGIDMGYDSAVGAVTRLAEGVNAALRAVIKPGSPSKVTTWMGHMIGQGLALGMLNERGTVARASSALGLAAIPTLPAIPAYAPIARQGGGGGTVIQISPTTHVTVEGTVQAEDDLTLKIVRSVNQGLADADQQLKRSLGVS